MEPKAFTVKSVSSGSTPVTSFSLNGVAYDWAKRPLCTYCASVASAVSLAKGNVAASCGKDECCDKHEALSAKAEEVLPPALTRCVEHVSWNQYITPLPECESCKTMQILTSPESTHNGKFVLRQLMWVAERLASLQDRVGDLERSDD